MEAITNALNLKGRTFMVTGASSGIGRTVSQFFSQLGAKLILVSRNEEQLAATLSSLSGTGHQLLPFDFSDCSGLDKWVGDLVKSSGKLDGLVHCAGIQTTEPLRFITEKSTNNVMQLNVNSAILITKSLRKKKALNEGASIVYMSSVVGILGEVGMAAYSASKGALISLTKSLAAELAPEKVRVNCVAPAIVRTEMAEKLFANMNEEQYANLEAKHLLGFGDTQDVANGIAFLVSDLGRWITGTCLVMDGGYCLAKS